MFFKSEYLENYECSKIFEVCNEQKEICTMVKDNTYFLEEGYSYIIYIHYSTCMNFDIDIKYCYLPYIFFLILNETITKVNEGHYYSKYPKLYYFNSNDININKSVIFEEEQYGYIAYSSVNEPINDILKNINFVKKNKIYNFNTFSKYGIILIFPNKDYNLSKVLFVNKIIKSE